MREWNVISALRLFMATQVGWIIKLQFGFLFVLVLSIITFIVGSFTSQPVGLQIGAPATIKSYEDFFSKKMRKKV